MTGTRHAPSIAPVAPCAEVVARPLATPFVVDEGFWAERQRVNGAVSLRRGWEWLHRSGALPNFQLAAGEGWSDGFVGEVNQDAEVYKWVEAASYELARTGDVELRSWLERAGTAIVRAQEADGYLHTWHQLHPEVARFHGLRDGGPDETYTAGHAMQAAVAHARATGETVLVRVAVAVAACLKEQLFDRDPTMVSGHPGLETGLVELYRETGERWLLDLAAHLIDARGRGVLGTHRFGSSHYQDYLPIRELPVLTGHAVAGLYLMCGATDVAIETGDAELLAQLERIRDATVSRRLYLTGGLGSRPRAEAVGDDYELPSETSYCETCAAAGMVMWSWRLLLATGESVHADMIERVLFNALLVGVSLDGERFRYDNPLMVHAGHRTPAQHRSDARSEWFELACCPPNLMRILASLGHYAATEHDGELTLQQYFAGTLGWGQGTLRVMSGWPWTGEVALTYAGPSHAATLRLRMPAWSEGATIDDAPVIPERGYVSVSRRWQDGDTLCLQFENRPRFTEPHPRVGALRGCVAVERGPVVYAFEQVDSDAPLDGLRVDPSTPLADAWSDELGVPALLAESRSDDLAGWENALYRRADAVAPDPVVAAAAAAAIPYFAWGNRALGPMRVWVPRAEGA